MTNFMLRIVSTQRGFVIESLEEGSVTIQELYKSVSKMLANLEFEEITTKISKTDFKQVQHGTIDSLPFVMYEPIKNVFEPDTEEK